jgi:hypothetical protein
MRKASEKTAATQPQAGAWSGHDDDVWEGRVNQNDVPATQRPCLAFGCPHLGTITESVTASSGAEWLCRHHSGRKRAEFDDITRRLRLEAGHA